MCRLAIAVLAVCLMLAGCSTAQHKNVTHTNYGEAEYKLDQQQCRSQNSTIVMSSGYDDKSEVKVDVVKARACMAARGWQDGD